MEPHLVEVSRTQTPKTLTMPWTQPYVEQGLGLPPVEDLEDLEVREGQEDLEDPEEAHLRQSRLHTWFQLQQTPMSALWAHCPRSSTEIDSRPTPSSTSYSHTYG